MTNICIKNRFFYSKIIYILFFYSKMFYFLFCNGKYLLCFTPNLSTFFIAFLCQRSGVRDIMQIYYAKKLEFMGFMAFFDV